MQLKRIYLVRHGESAANVDLTQHKNKPDHAIELTRKGKRQAEAAGKFLQQHLADLSLEVGLTPKIRLWQSPYLRTRQTAEGVLKHCNKSLIHDVREDTMLVEQQFGLFDGLTEEEQQKLYPTEYANYLRNLKYQGKYWAGFPHGESPFDVDKRVRLMQGTFARDAAKHDIDHIIIVSHGITTRILTMRYLHENYEFYDQERNPSNGSVRLLSFDDGKWCDQGYIFKP